MAWEGLTLGENGILYGTTQWGGASGQPCEFNFPGCGTVFALNPTSGAENVVYRFKKPRDAASPSGPLVELNDAWYGVSDDDATGSLGYGAVYRVDAAGQEQVIYRFKGGTDGAYPTGNLVALDGRLYGTTFAGGGGGRGSGTVFEVKLAGGERILHRFAGSDGATPFGGLIALNGQLYGTTQSGGEWNAGTMFSVSPSGKEEVVYSFQGSAHNDGADPEAAPTAVSGVLYGTTIGGGKRGGGTVYKVRLSGVERILYHFRRGGPDGSFPTSQLLNLNGSLYGTTGSGGTNDDGVVFSITYKGQERVLHSFTGGADGGEPTDILTAANNALYGMTGSGGTGRCPLRGYTIPCGTVFELTPY